MIVLETARQLFPSTGPSPQITSDSSHAKSSSTERDHLSSSSSLDSFTSELSDAELEEENPALCKIYRQWKQLGPGLEKQIITNDHEYTLLTEIGSGSFKKVYLASSEGIEKVAILYANIGTAEKKAISDNEQNGLKICEKNNIPGTLRLIEPFQQIGKYWGRFITTYCNEGTVNEWAENQTLSSKLEVLYAVANTLEKLHSIDCAHSDIKSENIAIHDGLPVLLDYGSFREHASQVRQGGASISYLPPQHCSHSNAIQSDVFSLGVTVYEIIADKVECGLLCSTIMKQRDWHSPFAYMLNATQADIDQAIDQHSCSKELKSLLFGLLKINSEERFTSRQARENLEKIIFLLKMNKFGTK
jgi:serine/threonine protein kinase